MRCVLDTNIYISALLLSDSNRRRALNLVVGTGKILLSCPALGRALRSFESARLRRYLDEEDVRTFLAALTREAEWINPRVTISACRDPKDDKFLELAVSGHASHFVTGDSDLLVLHPFQEIAILSLQSFVATFAS